MTYPTAQNFYGVAIGSGTANKIVIEPRDPTSNDINYPLLQPWFNSTTLNFWALTKFISSSGVETANWTMGGGASVPTTFDADSGSATPAANILNVLGGTGISTSGSGNTVTIDALSTVPLSLTGNSGGAVSATANNINTVGTGSITVVGNPGTSTLTAELTGLTNHNVLVGAGTTTITNISPSATSGVPLISQGSAVDPLFGTATVPGGGTGDTSFTAYSVITGGTTSTGNLQNVVGVGTAGQILTSNGAGSLPSWQTSPAGAVQVNVQTFTTSGTYTPTSGMVYCIIQVVGGGGGGGGLVAGSPATVVLAGAGGGGGYAINIFSAATIGASKSVTIGAGGTGGAAGSNPGTAGGTTSVGALISATGGSGGAAALAADTTAAQTSTAPGVGSNGYINAAGGWGTGGVGVYITSGQPFIQGCAGGSSFFGGGAPGFSSITNGDSAAGVNAVTLGAGGSGATMIANGVGNLGGGNGAPGVVIVTEYI